MYFILFDRFGGEKQIQQRLIRLVNLNVGNLMV